MNQTDFATFLLTVSLSRYKAMRKAVALLMRAGIEPARAVDFVCAAYMESMEREDRQRAARIVR